ncbi:MAG: NAD(P)-dependent dehydrogenase (short-subunit alcohol dehydrogenase family) [Patiriisocius sp.]|jgi:NAD(P)-dependent dehydrogenase (short-subunit alcohol dehydrogenase family)
MGCPIRLWFAASVQIGLRFCDQIKLRKYMQNMDGEFAGKVVVVTGAGGGLGRSHALEFARRGACVVVNDLGGAIDGSGSGHTAQTVVDEIHAAGGSAVASTHSVASEASAAEIVAVAVESYGTIDIVVNNAGILRDKTFANLTMKNFRAVLDVHLLGAVYVTHAAWPILAKKGWGRVVLTASESGLFGTFGQSNYAAAKMGLIGLMNVLQLEGGRKGIRVNCLVPAALTRMTESLPGGAHRGNPQQVSPAVLYLSSEGAPNGVIMQASSGKFSILKMQRGEEIDLGDDCDYEKFSRAASQILDDV